MTSFKVKRHGILIAKLSRIKMFKLEKVLIFSRMTKLQVSLHDTCYKAVEQYFELIIFNKQDESLP